MNALFSNRPSFLSLIALAVAGQSLLAAAAFARTETARWTHSSPTDVLRFELQVGDASGAYTETVNLGKPTPDGSGVYSASFTVADTRSVYVALRAVGASGSSAPSNEQFRQAPATGGTGSTGGGTTGGGTTGGGSTTTDVFDSVGSSDPAVSGAQVRFDFSGGSTPSWQDTGAGFSIFPDDSLFSASSVGGNTALWTGSAASDIHSHYNSGSASIFSNVQYLGRMAIGRAGAGVGVTTYSLYPNFDRYYALRAVPGGSFEVIAHPYGGLSCGAAASTGVVPQAGKWYEFDLTVESLADRNLIAARVWLRGTSKPSSPQVVCADLDVTRPKTGRIGVWATATGQKAWDDLQVVPLPQSGSGSSAGPLEPPTLISIQPLTP